jgi:peptide/nickel transport system permease protein
VTTAATVTAPRWPRVARRVLGRSWAFFVSSPAATVGLVLLLVFLGLAIAGATMHQQAYEQSLIDRLDPPRTPGHLLGTDTLGRDVLARIMVAVRISLEIGGAAVLIAGSLGVEIGMAAG